MIRRDGFFDAIDTELGIEDRERIEWAYSLAKNYHRSQTRDSSERYFEHCKAVAMISLEFPPSCPSEVILCLLHDVYEDQNVPRGMMRQLFGERIDEGLRALSNCRPFYRTKATIEKIDRPKEEYFSMLMDAPLIVRRVKLADRLHNLRTLAECTQDKIRRKVVETVQYIYSLAEMTDERFLNAIRQECERYGHI